MGASVIVAGVAIDADFLCFIVVVRRSFKRVEAVVEVAGDPLTRRFFACVSLSVIEVEFVWKPLFTSFDGEEVVGFVPMPFSKALNFRFVAFISMTVLATTLSRVDMTTTYCAVW